MNLLVDVLQKLNKLNIKFQYDMVDITTISTTIDIIVSILSSHFNPGMDLGLVIQARIWKKSLGNLHEIFNWVMETMQKIV